MTTENYVNAIVKKIKCSRERKDEIKKQLQADINGQLQQGISLEKIMVQMGTAIEIAEGFNETIPEEEKKRYTRNKLLKIILIVLVILSFIIFFVYWTLPKGQDINKSKHFNQEQVTEAMKETIRQLNASDYEALQTSAISQMQPFLTEEQIAAIKSSVSGDWGEFENFGPSYIMELSQQGQHFAVGEITVTYENISVTFRLTYDQDMKLAGMYVR